MGGHRAGRSLRAQVLVVVPGDPEKSLLIKAVRYTDEDLRMPPRKSGGRLPDEQIADLEAWVKMGAPLPRSLRWDRRSGTPTSWSTSSRPWPRSTASSWAT